MKQSKRYLSDEEITAVAKPLKSVTLHLEQLLLVGTPENRERLREILDERSEQSGSAAQLTEYLAALCSETLYKIKFGDGVVKMIKKPNSQPWVVYAERVQRVNKPKRSDQSDFPAKNISAIARQLLTAKPGLEKLLVGKPKDREYFRDAMKGRHACFGATVRLTRYLAASCNETAYNGAILFDEAAPATGEAAWESAVLRIEARGRSFPT